MRLAKYVKFREEKFGGVLFETRSERVYTLNPAAAAVIREIESGRPEDEIVPTLRARFDAGDGVIEQDVFAFLDTLRREGLVG
jgi:hypothetical protein